MINIVLIGDDKSGKTSFMLRNARNHFPENYEPTLEDNYETEIILKDKTKIKVGITNPAVQDEYKSLYDQYKDLADAFIVLFSTTDRKSFQFAEEELKDLRILRENDMKAVLVGTDCNSPTRALTYADGKELANQFHIKYIEVSIKENYNVDEVFHIIGSILSESFDKSTSSKKQKCRI